MRLDAVRQHAIDELVTQIDTVQLGSGPILGSLAPSLHQLIGGEMLWSYRPVRGVDGWDLAEVHIAGAPAWHVERFRRCIARERGDFAWYGPTRPHPAQRNRVIEAREAVRRSRPGYFETTPLYEHYFRPLRLDAHHQLRVLLCEGDRLLAWFGIYQQDRPDRAQWAMMRALVPSLRRRLAREQQLRDATWSANALAASLELLAGPAWVLDVGGRVEAASRRAQELLDRDLRQALVDATRGRPSRHHFDLIPLRDRGTSIGYLAVLREDAPSTTRVARAVECWRLTPRQTTVLRLLVRGMANATIAEELKISERAVELHVSAMFDKVGVDCRAALVAAVLGRD